MNLAGPDTPVIALIKYPALRLTINIQHFLSDKKCLLEYLIPGVHPPILPPLGKLGRYFFVLFQLLYEYFR